MSEVFTPIGATVNVAGTTSTGNVAIGTPMTGGRVVQVFNAGAVAAFVEVGASGITAAATTSMPIGPGGTDYFDIGNATHMAVITASSTAVVYATPGLCS